MLENLLAESELNSLRTALDGAQHVVVTCHVSPDGDAVGSVMAVTNYLLRKGKDVTPITPNAFPDFLKWVPGAERIIPYEKNEERANPIVAAADLIVCVDFNAPGRMEKLAEPVMANETATRIMIDHHLDPTDFCQQVISFPEMSSTCELLFRLFEQLGEFDDLTMDEAACLYTGMMTDTGGFTYNSNRSDIYFIIGKLLTKGIDKDQIYRNVFNDYSAERFRLLGYMLYVKMEVFNKQHTVLMTMTREEQRRFSHKKGDTEGFVNMPLQISGMRLSIFMRENTDKDTIRISLRSVGDFPCNRMAEEFFNGGGHLNASGGELVCSMPEAIEIARSAIRKYAPLLTDKPKD